MMRRRLQIYLAPLLLSVLWLYGCPSQTKTVVKRQQPVAPKRTAEGAYQEALLMHREKQSSGKANFDEVIKLYNEALSLNPSLNNAHFNLGAIYERIGEYKKAANHFGQIINSDSKNSEAMYRLAQVYVRLRKPHRALRLLNRFMRLNPKVRKSPKMLLNIATVQAQSGDTGNALITARKVLALDSKNIEAYRLIARVYLKRREYNGVHVVYQLTEKLKKKDARLMNIRGRAYIGQKKYPQAILSFSNAVKLQPDLFAAQMNLGTLALRYYDKRRALLALRKAANLRPRNKQALMAYAVALRANKKHKLAEKIYKNQLLRFYPNDGDAHFNLAVLYLNFMNKLKIAKRHLRKFIGYKGGQITQDHISYKLMKKAEDDRRERKCSG